MPANKRPPVRNPLPLILIGAGAVLILGFLGWMAGSGGFAPAPTPTARVYPEVQRVSGEQAGQAAQDGEALILDVRDAGSYAQSHAAGAVNIPLNELGARLNELDPSQWIIAYCT